MTCDKSFVKCEAGVVTIEWVAIAAVAFLAAVAITGTMMTGANDLGTAVSGEMSATADEIEGNGGG